VIKKLVSPEGINEHKAGSKGAEKRVCKKWAKICHETVKAGQYRGRHKLPINNVKFLYSTSTAPIVVAIKTFMNGTYSANPKFFFF